MRRSKLVALLIATSLLGSTCLGCTSREEPSSPSMSESAAEARSMPRVVSASGQVVPVRWATLSFPLGGQLEELSVAPGAKAEPGMVMARLEASDLERAVGQAEAALATARAALSQVLASPRSQEVAVARQEVAAASASLAAVQAAGDQAQAALQGAKASEEAEASALAQARAALRAAGAGEDAAQAELESAKAEVDMARAAVAAAEANLTLLRAGATTQQRAIAKLEVERARNDLWGAQSQRDALGGIVDRGYMKDANLNAAEAAVGSAHVTLAIAEESASEIDAGPRPEDLAPMQAQVRSARAALGRAESQSSAAEAGLERAESDVALAEAQVRAAMAQADRAGAQVSQADAQLSAAKAEIDASQARAAQAQARLELLIAGPRPEDVAVAEARVAEAQAGLEAAASALAKTRMVCPFAGTVSRTEIREGEVTSPGQPVLHLGDLASLQVETTDLNEVDIAQVAIGQQVEITFDALPERAFGGRVERIEPMSTPGQGGTNYTTVISLDELDDQLRWGMTAFVDIVVGE